MQRESFIFYQSFKSAADSMSNANRLAFYDAIIGYALTGKEPKSLKKPVQSCWDLVKPIIDSNKKSTQMGQKVDDQRKPVVLMLTKPLVPNLQNPMKKKKMKRKIRKAEKGNHRPGGQRKSRKRQSFKARLTARIESATPRLRN